MLPNPVTAAVKAGLTDVLPMENASWGEDRSSFTGIKTGMKRVFMNSDTFLEEVVTDY